MKEQRPDEVTPPEVYFNRRKIMRAGTAAASVAATAAIYRWLNPTTLVKNNAAQLLPGDAEQAGLSSDSADMNQSSPATAASSEPSREELLRQGFVVDEESTRELYITNYNNFYEFTTSKEGVAALAADFKTDGWQVKVDGLVDKPRAFTIDQLHGLSKPQERIYRMRCVEGWSMVIPWVGVPLAHLLEAVAPQASARYVAFETLLDVSRMPGQQSNILQWPYVEGLRLMKPCIRSLCWRRDFIAKLCRRKTALRFAWWCPWKYGFKGIKSIVRISLVADEPPTSWNRFAPNEYGFYANVNPAVDHPRWSQGNRTTHW